MSTGVASYDAFDFADEVISVDIKDPMRVMRADVPKRHGALLQDVPVRGVKTVTFIGSIYGKNYDITNPFNGLHSRIDQYNAKSMLFNKKLRIHNDRYLNAYPVGFRYVPIEGSSFTVVNYEWVFECLDPFYYSDIPESHVVTLNSSDPVLDVTQGWRYETFSIQNSGNLFVYPKVTVVMVSAVPQRYTVQFVNQTTGKQWSYEFDHPGGTKTLVVDTANFSVKIDNTDDLTNWQGTFVWLDAGTNNMRVAGDIDATYTIEWTPRYT